MGRVYALSDLHGNRKLFNKVLEYLKEDDQIFFLGDAIDRGLHGYDIMKKLLADPRVVYIKGNHEMMMQDTLEGFKHGKISGYQAYYLWAYNGGEPTYNDWVKDGADKEKWINTISEMYATAEYQRKDRSIIYLSHAGFTEGRVPEEEYNLVWDRDHFMQEEPIENKNSVNYIVHGHTPVPIMEKMFIEVNHKFNKEVYKYKNIDGALFYGEYGKKICIDCGSAFTNHTVLLDLDTLEVIPFDVDNQLEE